MIGRAGIAALVLLASPVAAAETSLADLAPDAVAALVDLRSFPNSTGPRREDHLKTFSDYGFTDVSVVDKTVELREPDGSWMFAVTVLSTTDEGAVLCVLDRALGGPTYHAQNAEAFMLADGMLVATGEAVVDPACVHIGE